MARLWGKFEGDVKKLIGCISGFQEHEENFGLCLQFAQSNILYHQFLSVDSHKIQRSLKGLEEKFAVHSDEPKANALRELVSSFLDSPAFEYKEHGRTDTHYSILSLLINLANTPTGKEYIPRKARKLQEVEDDFDWKAYLLEGEDIFTGPFPPTPEWSEEEDDEDDMYPPSRPPRRFLPSPTRAKASQPLLPAAPLVSVGKGPGEGECQMEEVESWLERNVIKRYWERQTEGVEELAPSREVEVGHQWEAFLAAQNPLYVPEQNKILSEYQVVREILWMISGLKETFVFEFKNGAFSVRQGIQVAHLTRGALEDLLSEPAHYGTMVVKLVAFVDDVTASLCFYGNDGQPDMRTCQTHQAFAGVLSGVLHEFRDDLMNAEKVVAQQETPTTLLHTLKTLRNWLPPLNLLHRLYEEGVVLVKDRPNVERAAHLLSVIYSALMDLDMLGHRKDMVLLLLRVWSQTSRPYWDIIDRWISQGKLSDPYKEFLIQRNKEVTSLEEHFWNSAFTIHIPSSEPTVLAATVTTSGMTPVGKPGQKERSKSRSATTKDGTGGPSDQDSSRDSESPPTPAFLQPVLRQIILAGKSMEMLQALGRLADIVDDCSTKDGAGDTLYEAFVKALLDHMGSNPSSDQGLEEDSRSSAEPAEGMSDTSNSGAAEKSSMVKAQSREAYLKQIDDQLKVKGVYDPLLEMNFAAIFDRDVFRAVPLIEREKYIEGQLRGLDLSQLAPIGLILEKCLYPYIVHRYKLVCSHLLDILKTEYHLLDYFAALRQFFLMEAGDTMYDFYTELFDKLRLNESWQDMSFLNMTLQGALSAHFPEHADRLYLSILHAKAGGGNEAGDHAHMTKSNDRQPINALDDLRMHYKTPWPINIILNQQNFQVYNAVFSFLLQIKRSKYCLDQLRFTDLDRDRPAQESDGHPELPNIPSAQQVAARAGRVHRMQLLRMKLMHFVNSLHNYIMTRILHSTGLEFQEALDSAQDLDDIITAHATYVDRLHERCLLHHMVRFFKVAITKVMNLALAFQVCWDNGVDGISEKQLVGMETELGRYLLFLGSFLSNVVKRGSHPNLESLAYALLASSERGNIQESSAT